MNFGELCEGSCDGDRPGCIYLEANRDIIAQYVELEAEAKKLGVLVREGDVACKGMQRFTRFGMENVSRCRFNVHAPVVSDERFREKLAEVVPTEPRPLIYE